MEGHFVVRKRLSYPTQSEWVRVAREVVPGRLWATLAGKGLKTKPAAATVETNYKHTTDQSFI